MQHSQQPSTALPLTLDVDGDAFAVDSDRIRDVYDNRPFKTSFARRLLSDESAVGRAIQGMQALLRS